MRSARKPRSRGRFRTRFLPIWLRQLLMRLDKPRWFVARKSTAKPGGWRMEQLSPLNVLEILVWQLWLVMSSFAIGLLLLLACTKLVAPPERLWHLVVGDVGIVSWSLWGQIRAVESFLLQRVAGRSAKRHRAPYEVAEWLLIPWAWTLGTAIMLGSVSVAWLLCDWLL